MSLVNTLKQIGYTEYESKIYLILLEKGALSIAELTKYSKVPRTKIYPTLEKLELKDAITKTETSPKIFRANNPSFLKSKIKELSNSVDEMTKLYNQPKKEDEKGFFWIIKGRNKNIKKLYETHLIAKEEILACTELDKMTYENQRIIKTKIKKGVKVKFITNFNIRHVAIYKVWMDLGVQIRIYNNKRYGNMLPRITVQDSKISRFTLGSPNNGDESENVSFWNEGEVFAFMLKKYFQVIWKESKSIKEFI